jgi:hypothetical protein
MEVFFFFFFFSVASASNSWQKPQSSSQPHSRFVQGLPSTSPHDGLVEQPVEQVDGAKLLQYGGIFAKEESLPVPSSLHFPAVTSELQAFGPLPPSSRGLVSSAFSHTAAVQARFPSLVGAPYS